MINYFLRKSRQTNPLREKVGVVSKILIRFLLRLVKKLSDYDDGEAIGTSG